MLVMLLEHPPCAPGDVKLVEPEGAMIGYASTPESSSTTRRSPPLEKLEHGKNEVVVVRSQGESPTISYDVSCSYQTGT